MTNAPDGFWCPACQIHRTSSPDHLCPCCAPNPVRTGPPVRMPLDRHIATSGGEA
jgi:hypothetical protein